MLRATVIFEVIIEIFLFLLPIPVVMKLQMEKSKKIILIAFFGMGIGYVIPQLIKTAPYSRLYSIKNGS